jgi:predicted nucleotidyltransferase
MEAPCNPPGGAIINYSKNNLFVEQKVLRLSESKAAFLKQTIRQHLPDASVYLFGSRAHDDQKGGDIDILVIGDRELSGQEKRDILISFYKEFGEQKIDLVSYSRADDDKFKRIALQDGTEL